MTAGPMPTPSLAGTNLTVPIYSDLSAAASAWSDGKLGFGDITAMADLGLGVLNTALDPVGAVLGSAVDYLMNLLVNNIEFLGKFVNDLLGDPDSITKTAQSWSTAGVTISESANRHVGYLADTPSWTGPASDSYKDVVRGTHEVYLQASGAAADVSGWIGVAGSLVATFRAFMWGMLKDFITQVIEAALLALAAAIPSFGASIGAFTAWFGGRMAMMGGKFAKTLSQLMTKIGALARKLGMSGRQFDVAAHQLRQVAGKLGRNASGRFGQSGMTPNPRMPGENMPGFNKAHPGYEDLQKNVKRGKNATNAVDQGAHNHQDGTSTPINDLPDGY